MSALRKTMAIVLMAIGILLVAIIGIQQVDGRPVPLLSVLVAVALIVGGNILWRNRIS